MKHEPYTTANALAVTTVIVYVVCVLAVSLFPDLTLSIARSWFHGVELQETVLSITLGSFVLGIVTTAIGAWLLGYIFSRAYNYFAVK